MLLMFFGGSPSSSLPFYLFILILLFLLLLKCHANMQSDIAYSNVIYILVFVLDIPVWQLWLLSYRWYSYVLTVIKYAWCSMFVQFHYIKVCTLKPEALTKRQSCAVIWFYLSCGICNSQLCIFIFGLSATRQETTSWT